MKLQRATAHADAAQAALAKAQQEQREAEQEFQEARDVARPAAPQAPASHNAAPAVNQRAMQNWLEQLHGIVRNSSFDGAGNLVIDPGRMEAVIGAAFDIAPPRERPASARTPVRSHGSCPPTPISNRFQGLAYDDGPMNTDEGVAQDFSHALAAEDYSEMDGVSDEQLLQHLQALIPPGAHAELRRRIRGKQGPLPLPTEPARPTKAEQKAAKKNGMIKKKAK